MKIESEKVAADAVKKAGKGLGKFFGAVGAGAVSVLTAISEEAEARNQSLQEIEERIAAHEARFGPARRFSPAPSPRLCSSNTSFWDCEDANCFWHKSEKERRGIGTPTRDFRQSE